MRPWSRSGSCSLRHWPAAWQWRGASRPARPFALALACGIDYGFAAFVVKLMTADFGGGLPEVFSHWPIYALAIIGPMGFLLNQNAYQQTILIAPVVAVITICDPIVSIALAYFWLNEKLSSSSLAVVGQVIALVVMATGIVVIAHHSPMAARQLADAAGPHPDS